MTFSTKTKFLCVGLLSPNSEKLFSFVGMLLTLLGTLIMTRYDYIVWIVNVNKTALYSLGNRCYRCPAYILQQTLIFYILSFSIV